MSELDEINFNGEIYVKKSSIAPAPATAPATANKVLSRWAQDTHEH